MNPNENLHKELDTSSFESSLQYFLLLLIILSIPGPILLRQQPPHLPVGQPHHLVDQPRLPRRLLLDSDHRRCPETEERRGKQSQLRPHLDRGAVAPARLGPALHPLLGHGEGALLPPLLPRAAVLLHADGGGV